MLSLSVHLGSQKINIEYCTAITQVTIDPVHRSPCPSALYSRRDQSKVPQLIAFSYRVFLVYFTQGVSLSFVTLMIFEYRPVTLKNFP